MLTIITTGIAPGIALLSYFYLKDKYETEPIGMILKTFIFGALIVFPVMAIQYAFETEHILQGLLTNSFLLNGLLEEFFKWLIIIYTAYRHTAFNERYDGIIYTVSVSLGFATVENILYLTVYGIHYALFRAILPVSSHALFAVIMGYYIGKAKFSVKKKRYLFIGLLIAALIHGLYDLILHIDKAWLYIIIPFMIYLWWSALRKIKLAHNQHQLWLEQKNI
ncbi:glutamic-type intramembrane protease PrsW [Scopulibacillus cellulosilyticus]|uniref:Protease PrsW n=1 Tax=Scopulibacillus cellulosilyticus TaxID=2665665 RepID=A0ABW2PQ65_9BACL